MSGKDQVVINVNVPEEETRPVPWRHLNISLDAGLVTNIPVNVTIDGKAEVHGPFRNLVLALDFANEVLADHVRDFRREVSHEQPDTPE